MLSCFFCISMSHVLPIMIFGFEWPIHSIDYPRHVNACLLLSLHIKLLSRSRVFPFLPHWCWSECQNCSSKQGTPHSSLQCPLLFPVVGGECLVLLANAPAPILVLLCLLLQGSSTLAFMRHEDWFSTFQSCCLPPHSSSPELFASLLD